MIVSFLYFCRHNALTCGGKVWAIIDHECGGYMNLETARNGLEINSVCETEWKPFHLQAKQRAVGTVEDNK